MLVTLAGLEIVLGVENIVFIANITGKLAPAVQARARPAARPPLQSGA